MNNFINTEDIDINALDEQIRECKSTQSWAPNSIRSGWGSELQAVSDCIEDLEAAQKALAEAIEKAEETSAQLADAVIQRIEDFPERVATLLVDSHDAPEGLSDWESIWKWATGCKAIGGTSAFDVWLDESGRDSVTIDSDAITAWVTRRRVEGVTDDTEELSTGVLYEKPEETTA